MDNKIKRRAFLAGTAALVAAPLAYTLLGPGGRKKRPHQFSQELKRVQSLVDLPVQSIAAPSQARLTLTPPIDQAWNYVVFAPSYFPEGVSKALGNEPDAFVLREGKFTLRQTNKGQIILTGGDKHSVVCHPQQVEDRPKNRVSLLARDNRFHLARVKGKEIPAHLDRQFVSLLTLAGVPQGELTVGKEWKSNAARLKPFDYPTQYEVVGFAEIAGRKTVNVQFSGNIPNIAQMPGVNADKPAKDARLTNKHRGNAYFDLETGCLVRQEVEMTSVTGGLQGYVAKDGSKDFVVKSNVVIQLFPV